MTEDGDAGKCADEMGGRMELESFQIYDENNAGKASQCVISSSEATISLAKFSLPPLFPILQATLYIETEKPPYHKFAI